MRRGNECNEAAAPGRVWGGNVDTNHGALLNGDRGDASQLGDEIAEVWLMSDEEESLVTTSSEEFGDMCCGWAVSKVLVNRRGGL